MSTPKPDRDLSLKPAWAPYLLAVVSSVLFVLLKMGLHRITGADLPFLLLFFAVFLSAYYGGMGPGLLAAVLTGLAGDYFFWHAPQASPFAPAPLLHLGVYAIVSAIVIGMCAAHHRSRADNEQLRRNLEQQVEEFQTIVASQTRTETALRESETKFRALFENSRDGIGVSAQGKIVFANAAYVQLLGYASEEEMVGLAILDIVAPADRALIAERRRRRAQGEAEPELYDLQNLRKDGALIDIENHISTYTLDGEMYTLVIARDVSTRRRADDALRAQEEIQRFLARTGEALASSLDYQTTLNSVAQLVVPHLADWCFIDVVTEDRTLERVAAAHADPQKRAFQLDLQEHYPTRPDDPVGPASVLRTGKSEWVRHITEEMIHASAYDEEHFRLLKEFGLTSLLCVPLLARDRTVGVLTLISAESKRVYGEEDVALAEDLAHRAALAVDNARLYRAAQAEITAREQMQQQLAISEERQRLAVEGAEIGTWHWDLPTHTQIWSEKCKEMFRLPIDQPVSYESFQARVHPEDRDRVDGEVAQAVADRSNVANDYRIVWPDGSVHWMSARGRCYCDANGNAVRFEGIVQNVDARHEAEERLLQHQTEIEGLNQRLRRAMTETHHRVKNNLQVISAMIDLQTMEETETLPVSEFTRLSQHVRMLATVHDLLTEQAKRDNEANTLSARQLFEQFLPLVQQMAYQHRLTYHFDDATLTSDQGTSLALIANEIYSNAIKHGNSEVNIRFAADGATATLEVSDDGPGFPPDFDPSTAANTGLELVLNLTALDLRGTIRFDNRPEGGGCVCMTFPIPTDARITPTL